MKKLLYLLLFINFQAFSQEKAHVIIRIESIAKSPVAGAKVVLTNSVTGKLRNTHTDNRGIAEFLAERNFSYQITVNGKPKGSIDVPADGISYVNKSITISEGSNFEAIPIDTIIQKLPKNVKRSKTEMLAKFQITNLRGKRLPELKMSLYSRQQSKVYLTKANELGIAVFKVPPGEYSVSVEQLHNYQSFTVRYHEDMVYTKKLRFEPTSVTEYQTNDTVIQELDEYQKPSSARVLMVVTVKDTDQKVLPNEPVFMNVVENQLVYKSTTNRFGRAQFLLPKGYRYVLNLKYERDVHIYDWPRIQSLHTTRSEVRYIGSETIETFYETSKRNAQGFLTEFMPVSISPYKPEKNLREETKYGFDLNFSSNSPVCSPLVANNKLYSGGGYYSHEFYCFSNNGMLNWAVSLGEGGPSAAVYEDGMILLITQSCTLYAIDAETGRLAWSKWLGPSIYHSPSVSNGKVYAVYPNEVNFGHGRAVSDDFALICFDLKTGNIDWQQHVDAEVLAAPVIYKNGVYITTLKGSLYHFSTENGQKIAHKNIAAVSPPTVVGNSLYVSIKQGKNRRTLAKLKTTDFGTNIQVFSKLNGAAYFAEAHNLSAAELMNHNDAGILHVNNKNVAVIGGNIVCFSPETGNEIWKIPLTEEPVEELSVSPAGMPIFAGNQIISATRLGKVLLIDANSGKINKTYETGKQLVYQPSVHNGKIYVGTAGGKLVSINTFDKSISGWNAMGGSGARNAAIE